MIKTNKNNLEERFDANKNVLDYFETGVILNIERACQATLDMASHIIKIKSLGVPQSHRDAFIKLEKEKIITPELSKNLQAMAGFRNIAVHDYSSINIEVGMNIIEHHLTDLQTFAQIILNYNN